MMAIMPETRGVHSVVEAAEQAAGAGDYSSAEQLLREAAVLQEENLGPLHPELANILNNLGVVCEILGKPTDAERCYRRAHAIATEVLEPDHPFVATSRKNLSDFCESRGKLVESPPPSLAVAGREPHATSSAHVPDERPSHSKGAGSLRRWSPLTMGAVAACVVVFAMLIVIRPFSSIGRSAAAPERPSQLMSGGPRPTLAAEPLPVEPTSSPKDSTTNGHHAVGVTAKADPAESRATPTSASALPLVADAHLCRSLSTASRGSPDDWQCDPVSLPVGQGSLFFYTRLKSENDTTVQHRWYRGDRLQQVVELRIEANPGSGYRTYSRSTVDTAGDWRVELRTNEGILLHEERFVVR